MRIVFDPTLVPDPFGETSPELCWQLFLNHVLQSNISIRLTQFGWTLILHSSGSKPIIVQADDFASLKANCLSHPQLPTVLYSELDHPWVLAYEITS